MRRALLAGWLSLAACGGAPTGDDSGSTTGMDLAVGGVEVDSAMPLDLSMPDFAVPPDLTMIADMASGYPPGPYGSAVGDTIAPLQWEGYVNPGAIGLASTKPYGVYAMNDLHKSGKKFALLYAADFW